MHKISPFLLAVVWLSLPAHADLPLSLEGIAPEQNRFKFGLSLSHYNQRTTSYESGAPTFFHTPQNTVIEIPGSIEAGRHNGDMLYATANLQYGITDHTELYASLGGYWQHQRSHYSDGEQTRNHRELAKLTLGVNHVFLNDGKNPALIGVLETSAMEKIRGKNVYGRSWYIGINSYKAIDPVVFSFSGGHRFNFDNSTGRKPGNYWLLRPGVSFAANDRTTFSAHLKWTSRHADRIDDKRHGIFESDTHAIFGVGYAFSKQTSISADVQWHLSGDDGSVATLAFQHKF